MVSTVPGPRRRGRKLTPPEVVASVLAVFALSQQQQPRGSVRSIARACGLSFPTVRKIIERTHGQASPNLGSMLAEGEQQTTKPTRCEVCGAINSVVPCRTCKARRGLADLRRLQSLAGRAKSRNADGLRPRRRRRARDQAGQRLPSPQSMAIEPLALELKAEQSLRLTEVQRRQIARGERPTALGSQVSEVELCCDRRS
jgi:hypothetical protein